MLEHGGSPPLIFLAHKAPRRFRRWPTDPTSATSNFGGSWAGRVGRAGEWEECADWGDRDDRGAWGSGNRLVRSVSSYRQPMSARFHFLGTSCRSCAFVRRARFFFLPRCNFSICAHKLFSARYFAILRVCVLILFSSLYISRRAISRGPRDCCEQKSPTRSRRVLPNAYRGVHTLML